MKFENISFIDAESDVEFVPLLSEEEAEKLSNQKVPEVVPLLPVRNTVLFPGVVVPINAGRDSSITLLKEAQKSNSLIGVVSQKNHLAEDPLPKDLYKIGTIARIIRLLKMPDGNLTVILQGVTRFQWLEIVEEKPYYRASIKTVKDQLAPKNDKEFSTIIDSIKEVATQIINENPNIPSEAVYAIKNIESPSMLMRTIQEELGGVSYEKEIEEMRQKAKDKKWPADVAEKFEKELRRFEHINSQSPEFSLQRSYLEFLLDLPWHEYSKDNFDLKHAQKILDQDHFGLEKVKERILEYLAVLKLRGDMKSPIICLYGPPGVGKTSLGKSIAASLERKYVRISLGGLYDESEIRGHRKTYIGAMPGRIIQSIKRAQTSNPVFVLDEIDKLGRSNHGDPSSAMLEVLDPEQNTSFYDNYLEMGYDLSKVMFIATANSLDSIHPALLDRMEIIHINGYTVEEKIEIAKRHLLPKQLEEHGLKAKDLALTQENIEQLIDGYTRESGVRGLDKVIAKVVRRKAKDVVLGKRIKKTVKSDELLDILGPARITEKYTGLLPAGVVVGLAWTRVGGDILYIESSVSKGKGNLSITGNLGKIMNESANIAMEYIKANYESLGLDQAIFGVNNIHIHVPKGAVPKDGPSAGITMLTSLVSSLSQRQVKRELAMTGEITLHGKVLPVGGIKEKILAAKRAGIKTIILSKHNEKDILELKKTEIKGLKFHYVEHVSEVIDLALYKKKVKKVPLNK
ncbi:unnamed protein product [Cyprideis torosa]|uniref:Lon protease homolog n=1 Tax=Cyprideis torosa TaxID=163714 RepID=A0A7R8WR49_9CRUS|nr:unnamed protein product [Cyprideis torosa]CAG0906682.1 unnamed protein product [Cyprideis torosa]